MCQAGQLLVVEGFDRLSIGRECCISAKPSAGSAPTRWVGESGVARDGSSLSKSSSSRISPSYSASLISGRSRTKYRWLCRVSRSLRDLARSDFEAVIHSSDGRDISDSEPRWQ